MVTRRRVVRTGLTSVAAVSGTAAALGPMLTAGRRSEGGGAADGNGPGAAGDGRPALFDELYRGRRIQAFDADGENGEGAVAILIDGQPLHVMRRVDGSWISMANHFQPYLTPLATARGAVDAIGRAELSTDDRHRH